MATNLVISGSGACDKEVYDIGLVGILKDLDDRIDVAVAAAYGWPANVSGAEILTRLVALNRERAKEEASGLVRWLRPEYQNPQSRAAAATALQGTLAVEAAEAASKPAWPSTLPEQIAAVMAALQASGQASPEQIARRFQRARKTTVLPRLESLAALGQTTAMGDGRFAV